MCRMILQNGLNQDTFCKNPDPKYHAKSQTLADLKQVVGLVIAEPVIVEPVTVIATPIKLSSLKKKKVGEYQQIQANNIKEREAMMRSLKPVSSFQ